MHEKRTISSLTRPLFAIAAALLAVSSLAACSSSAGSTASSTPSATGSLSVSGAYINEPTMPNQTGAFALVTNSGATAVSLTSVSVPATAAESASLHKTVMVNGAMAMVPLTNGLAIPANGQVQLKPGGFHIMLMMPKVTAGQSVPITFNFSDGSKMTVSALVKAATPMASPSAS